MSDDERETEQKVRVRRWKRRLKAAAALALAAAAGTFLACTRIERRRTAAPGDRTIKEPPSVTTPDAGADIKDATVDREEHRKGMPVKDNLLE